MVGTEPLVATSQIQVTVASRESPRCVTELLRAVHHHKPYPVHRFQTTDNALHGKPHPPVAHSRQEQPIAPPVAKRGAEAINYLSLIEPVGKNLGSDLDSRHSPVRPLRLAFQNIVIPWPAEISDQHVPARIK